jgi:hypothetical protein
VNSEKEGEAGGFRRGTGDTNGPERRRKTAQGNRQKTIYSTFGLFSLAFFLLSAYPLVRAWLACRHTSLNYAVLWTAAAWLAWLLATSEFAGADSKEGRYVALCLTGCAGIAVLGARRPLVMAWNAVLAGLLVVLLLPLAESALLATPLFDPLRLVFVTGTLAVGVINYLPTRFAGPVGLVGVAGAVELLRLIGRIDPDQVPAIAPWVVPLALWLGLAVCRRRWNDISQFDREWLRFRDRYGLFWAQRVREQFNQAVENAGLQVRLTWLGLRRQSATVELSRAEQTAIGETLRALLKRF